MIRDRFITTLHECTQEVKKLSKIPDSLGSVNNQNTKHKKKYIYIEN
jgi:hypothetical protein